jgi:hypothetical protein
VRAGLGLEIHVNQRLTVVVADDETNAVVFLFVPRWREAARPTGHSGMMDGEARKRAFPERPQSIAEEGVRCRLTALGGRACVCVVCNPLYRATVVNLAKIADARPGAPAPTVG